MTFNKVTFKFLRDIEQNNNKQWFLENKLIYQTNVEQPSKKLLESLKSTLILLTDQEMEGKIFRFYRDVRFSKDKTPYKNHVRMLCYPEGRNELNKGKLPVYYLSIEATKILVGVGTMFFDKQMLEKFRKAMIDESHSVEFNKIINRLLKKGFNINKPALKRVPPHYDKNHENAEWLKYKGMAMWHELPIQNMMGEHALNDLMHIYETAQDFYNWLRQLSR